MLWLAKRVIFGKTNNNKLKDILDLNFSEVSILSVLAIITIFFGFYPQPIIDTMSISVNELITEYENALLTSVN